MHYRLRYAGRREGMRSDQCFVDALNGQASDARISLIVRVLGISKLYAQIFN